MQKFTSSDIKPFTFSDLEVVNDSKPTKFEAFSFKTIEGRPFNSERPSDETIRQERSFEKKNEFKMDDTVRQFRGLTTQEQNDLELFREPPLT